MKDEEQKIKEEIRNIVQDKLKKGLWSWETDDLISLDGTLISLKVSEGDF